MSNLKTLKLRIKSVKSTQKMTKAMKMVAASRLKKAKTAVEVSRPFADKIEEMVSNLASNVAERENLNEKYPLLTGKGKGANYLLVVLSSDRGLCGGLNSYVVKMTKARIQELEEQGRKVQVLCIGKKAHEQLKITHGDYIVDRITGIFKDVIEYETAQEIAQKVIARYDNDEFDICEIIYSKFKSAIAQEQVCTQVIPAQIKERDKPVLESPVEYEPGQEEILSDVLPRNLAIQIYKDLLENSASEQGARMAAMEAATNNAAEMIKGLTLVYNRTRQANITKELIDIISGANSV